MLTTCRPLLDRLRNPAVIAFTFAADLAHLAPARALARELALTYLPRSEADDLILAFGEALSNAIQHGSPRGRRSQVHILFCRDPGRIAFEITDEGPGFDPALVPEPAPGTPQEGGWGCFMIRRTTAARWTRTPAGMQVRLEKAVPGAVPGS